MSRSRSSFFICLSTLSLKVARENNIRTAPPCSLQHKLPANEAEREKKTKARQILTVPQLLTSLLVLVSQPLLPGMLQLFQPLAHKQEFGSVDWQTPWPEQGIPLYPKEQR